MTDLCSMQPCSSKRAALASFDHAYAVALRMRHETGRPQFVLRTGDPLQPFPVSSACTCRQRLSLTRTTT